MWDDDHHLRVTGLVRASALATAQSSPPAPASRATPAMHRQPNTPAPLQGGQDPRPSRRGQHPRPSRRRRVTCSHRATVILAVTVGVFALAPGAAQARFELGLQDAGFQLPASNATAQAAYRAPWGRSTAPRFASRSRGEQWPPVEPRCRPGFTTRIPLTRCNWAAMDLELRIAAQRHEQVVLTPLSAPAWAQPPSGSSSARRRCATAAAFPIRCIPAPSCAGPELGDLERGEPALRPGGAQPGRRVPGSAQRRPRVDQGRPRGQHRRRRRPRPGLVPARGVDLAAEVRRGT